MPDIPWLENDNDPFPDVELALTEPDGLLALGGCLTVERLIDAYHRGIFPWYEEGQPVLWWSPDPRCVLYPDQMHVSRSLKKILRNNRYHVTFDTAFTEVIANCATLRSDQEGTWITSNLLTAFKQLHNMGIAHSVEVWTLTDEQSQLVGGLYGIAMGRVFFGESMFSRRTDTSKVALSHLCKQLQAWNFNLIDCQVDSEHMQSLGAVNITRPQFISHLKQYIDNPHHSFWRSSP